MKEDFLALWVAFLDSMIRFWNNRFQRDNDEVIWLRNELEKCRIERAELIEKFTAPKFIEPEEQEPVDWKPLSRFVPLSSKLRNLEHASRMKAQALRDEAANAIRSTEEIERDLGIAND